MADSKDQTTSSPKPAATPPRVASPKSPASPSAVASPKSVISPGSAASPRSQPENAGQGEQHLEVDHDQEDDEHTLNEQLSTFTASLSSSVVDYPIEHGRRYHAYQRGTYLLPNDERELERLDVAHQLFIRTFGGRIYLAPLEEDKLQRILDIGTGTGALAIDLADTFPAAQVIGCDLSPTQTTWIPPNLKFEVDDIEKDWAYPFKFDYIVSRYMASSITGWPRLVEQAYENLSPGGWAEFQDCDLEFTSDDNTLTEEHYFRKWNNVFIEGLAAINRDARPGPKLHAYFEAAGFVNIHVEFFKVPMGSWPKDPQLKDTGLMNLVQMLDGMEGFSLKIFELAGWSTMETQVFLTHVRKEMKSNKCHTYLPLYVVYGQKPETAA